MVGSCLQLLQQAKDRLGPELVASPTPAGSKTAGINLATAQEAIAAFPAFVWGRDVENLSLSPLYRADTMQGELEGPAETLHLTDGKTEATEVTRLIQVHSARCLKDRARIPMS